MVRRLCSVGAQWKRAPKNWRRGLREVCFCPAEVWRKWVSCLAETRRRDKFLRLATRRSAQQGGGALRADRGLPLPAGATPDLAVENTLQQPATRGMNHLPGAAHIRRTVRIGAIWEPYSEFSRGDPSTQYSFFGPLHAYYLGGWRPNRVRCCARETRISAERIKPQEDHAARSP